MAKSDFNVEEDNDFQNQSFNDRKSFFGNNSTNSFNEPEIVYDEDTDKGPIGRITYFLTTINRSVIIFFGAILAAIVVAVIIIVAIVSGYNKSFKTEIKIPDVVYIGETAAISAISSGTGDVSKTVATFKTELIEEEGASKDDPTPDLPMELESQKMSGAEIYNTMIPIEEGGVTITVKATSGTHNMGKKVEKVYVCPRFDSSLVNNGVISVSQGDDLTDIIDFGPGNCSTKIKYKSSNEDIFTVDKEGKITGLKTGVANLIVTREKRSFSIPVHVTAHSISMSNFEVTPKKIQLTPGENRRLNVSYLPTNASTQNLKYSSNDSEVVSVDEYGKLVGLKEGSTEIVVNSTYEGEPKKVEVVVSKKVKKSGSTVTDIVIDNQQISMNQGESRRINYIITPDDAKDKTVEFTSSDEKIATVNKKGVIFAKKGGQVNITASTKDSVSKIVEVRIKSIDEPTVLADDGIIQNNWHNRDYKLKFSGGGYGATYYYGYNKDDLKNNATEVTLKKEGKRTVYTRACLYNLCGPTMATLSKIDTVKPKIIKIITRDDKNTDDKLIYVAAQDETSMVSKWCITDKDNNRGCNWMNISTIKNPVLSKRIDDYGQYFVFVKDEAGNISDSKSVTIDGDTKSNNSTPLDY